MPFSIRDDIRSSSENLVLRAQAGDRAALGQIFETHHRFIYKFIYAMLGRHTIAEELTQETFLGAFKNIGTLRGEARLQTWLCAIAKNLVYNSFRSNRSDKYFEETEVETLGLADQKNPTPVDQIVNKELNQVIAAALRRLDEDRRAIFILKEIQHLSYNEIADITGHSVPKLKTDLHRAKIEMRKTLRPYMPTIGGAK